MAIRVAINGFGRIGRLFFRSIIERSLEKDIKIVVINDLSSFNDKMHFLKYDSVHGGFRDDINVRDNECFDVGGKIIKTFSEVDPKELPWGDENVDFVVESTGRFCTKEKASLHIKAGAKRVLVTAPCENADKTVVYGVNHKELTDSHKILSNASCTTNCLAPIACILDKEIGISSGFMTTIHSYTADQNLIDGPHSDKRRARAAALSMIPTSTGAAKAVGEVLPNLKGKIDGTAIRVPTANVSLIDFTFVAKAPTSKEKINNIVKEAAQKEFKDIIDTTFVPLVSVDFNHNPHSAIFDEAQTYVTNGYFCRILAWYDNEWGFSNRLCDVLLTA
ncbi:MAG: type I glyceraldehyde-3-phosphate dehydrogenase [Alphaproteobacteria bacterium]